MADPTSPQPPADSQDESQLPYELPDIDLESDGLNEVHVPAGPSPSGAPTPPAAQPAQTTNTGPPPTPAPSPAGPSPAGPPAAPPSPPHQAAQPLPPPSGPSPSHPKAKPKRTFAEGLTDGTRRGLDGDPDPNPENTGAAAQAGESAGRFLAVVIAFSLLMGTVYVVQWMCGFAPDSAQAHRVEPPPPATGVRKAIDRHTVQQERTRQANRKWAEAMGRRNQALEGQQESGSSGKGASVQENAPASQPANPFDVLAHWVKKTRPDSPQTPADVPSSAPAGGAPSQAASPAGEAGSAGDGAPADPHADLPWHTRTPGGFSLTCVLRGPRGTRAIINNEILAKGDRIGNAKVIDIRPGFVLLVLDGKKFRLDLE